MIFSEVRKQDLEELQFAVAMLTTAVGHYERTKSGEEHVSFWNSEVDRINKLLAGDYTEREIKHKKLWAFLEV